MSVLVLRGGLGNQLFQLAASLTILGDTFTIHTFSGNPRRTNGEVDLSQFSLPINIALDESKTNRFTRKILSCSLVLGISSAENKFLKILSFISDWVGSAYFSILSRKPTKLASGVGVGFFESKVRKKSIILNGYFQTDFWARDSKTNEILQGLRVKSPSKPLLFWIEQINKDSPIIVHVRLGDYRSEPGIGILDSSYFYRALSHSFLKELSKNVWIFTDEPSSIEVSAYVPSTFNVKVFHDLSLSSAETLELMRHGSAYVISNSTFSWWAAYLSYNKTCPRFLPTPWFKNSKSPKGIAPLDWIEIHEPFESV